MNISKRFCLTVVLFVGALCLVGCSNQTPSPSATTASASESADTKSEDPNETTSSGRSTTEYKPAPSSANFLSDAEALKKAQSLLEGLDKFKGKDIQVFQSPHFYDLGNIVIHLQDPDKPENVDEYTYYDGQWTENGPVRLTGGGKLEDNLTPLKDMPFATIASIFKIWKEKAKGVEGAEEKDMAHAYVNINPVTAKRRWFCDSIEGSRAEYQIFFNLDGTLETYEKL